MKTKIFSIFIKVVLFSFLLSSAVAQDATKAYFRNKDGVILIDPKISDIDSIVFKVVVEQPLVVPDAVINLILEPDPFKEQEEFLLRSETIPGSERTYKTTEEIDGVITSTEWLCQKKRYSASQNPNDYIMFEPLSSVLWPGCLVQGKSIASGVPSIVPISVSKRKPGNISFAIVSPDKEGAVNGYTGEGVPMGFSFVNQAMNNVLSRFGGNGYARYSYEMDMIQSASDLNYKLKAGYSGGVVKTNSSFGIDWTNNRTRVLVKLYQIYYTMVWDDPEGINGVFTPDITVNDLKPYTGPGNPLCYISSVSYGRVYFLVYESTASKQDLEAALNFSLFKINTSQEAKHKAVMNQTSVRIMQIGGNAADGLTQATALDLGKLQAFLDKGANFSAQNPGAPISYTIKYLRDASLVRMNNTLDYQVEECEIVSKDVKDKNSSIKIQFGDYKISCVTSKNYYAKGQFWMGIEIGQEGGSILKKQPAGNSVYDDYGKYDDALRNNKTVVRTYPIKLSVANVNADKSKRLYIKFKVKTEAHTYYWGAPFGTIAWFNSPVTPSGEKIVYFVYDQDKNQWVSNEQSSAVYTTAAGTFTFTHTFNYAVTVE